MKRRLLMITIILSLLAVFFVGCTLSEDEQTLLERLRYNAASPVKLTIKTQPASQTKAVGLSVSFSVTATGGKTPYNYQWRKDGVNISGAVGKTYIRSKLTVADAGQYSVVVKDTSTPQASATSLNALLTVTGGTTLPIKLTTQPASQTKAVGLSVTFSVVASGGKTPYSYQWRKDGTNIAGATGNTYVRNKLTTTDAGQYSVLVKDSSTPQASITSNNAQLTITGGSVSLTLTAQPLTQTKAIGQSVTFSVTASGGKTPYSYQWRKNGTNITGGTGKSYSRSNLTTADAGLYSVIVKDASTPQASITSAIAQLTVNGGATPLTLSVQPESQTKTASQSVTFNVTATGGKAPYSYQWRKDGVSITAAIAKTYTRSNLTATDAGQYSVVVKDSSTPQTSLTSSNAQLTVSTGASPYSIEQAISDKAQLSTIAYDALAFFTGNLGSDSFFPPGKVADFFGFQYLRDVDEGELGHNTSFVTRIANNIFSILTTAQIAELKTLAQAQAPIFEEYASDRFPLMDAFRRLYDGELPSAKTGLSKTAVISYSQELYLLDGALSYHRAQVMGNILYSMTAAQKSALAALDTGNSLDWPDKPDQIDKTTMTKTESVLMMTYASELFSWYAGDVESDTYFCPERHGTYFGSFYLKDMPAMGNPNYTIGTDITGNLGEQTLKVLTTTQQQQITQLVEIQKSRLLQIVEARRQLSASLRLFMEGKTPDETAFMALVSQYGALDGENVYYYATHFSSVYKTLSAAQMQQLVTLRNLGVCPDGKAYQYSELVSMPVIMNTDFLFE